MPLRGFERGRRPAYVGARRCWRCTVVNLALVGLFAAGATVPLGWWAGIAAGLAGVGLVWWRGYLLPGTPWLAARVLPPRIRAWFGPDPPLTVLYRHGVLVRRHDGTIGFDPAFLAAIEAGDTAVDRSAIATTLASRLPARQLEAPAGDAIVDVVAAALDPCPRCGALAETPFGGCCGDGMDRRCDRCGVERYPSDGRSPSRAA